MEQGSTYAEGMINELLSVHALMNMYRVSGREETRKTAADWLPRLKTSLFCLERELTKEIE